jgi:hypothetical protein
LTEGRQVIRNCLGSTTPLVQTAVPPKEKKKLKNKGMSTFEV